MGASGGERLFLEKVHAILGEPMETFEHEECGDEGEEYEIDFFAEYGGGETTLDDGVARAGIEALDLSKAEGPQKDLLDGLPDENDGDEREVCGGHDGELRVGQVDQGAVEKSLLKGGVPDHGTTHEEREDDIVAKRRTRQGHLDVCCGEEDEGFSPPRRAHVPPQEKKKKNSGQGNVYPNLRVDLE